VEKPTSNVGNIALEKRFELETAQKIADDLLAYLGRHFVKYQICGSIRRKKPDVGDIDVVAIPKQKYEFGEETLSDSIKKVDPRGTEEAHRMGKSGAKRFLDGELIKRFEFKGMSVDLYLADEKTFGTLVLIRTGSKEHNIKLTTLAREKGLKLFASGKGLCEIDSDGNIVKTISTDESEILVILLGRIPFPEERD
jgi:DNA polymerase (family X)